MNEIIKMCIVNPSYLFKVYVHAYEHEKTKKFTKMFRKKKWHKESKINVQNIIRYAVSKITKIDKKHKSITPGRIATMLLDPFSEYAIHDIFNIGGKAVESVKSTKNTALFSLIDSWDSNRKIQFYYSISILLLFPSLINEINALTLPMSRDLDYTQLCS